MILRPFVFMKLLIRFYRLLNVLSIDVVAGAIVSALFFAKLLAVRILPYGLVALGLTVWIIYTADHLRDAKFIVHKASSHRHSFHQQNFNVLLIWICAAIVVDAVVILYTRKPVLEWGLILAGIVILYLIVQRYLKIFKELFVACIYTCGVLLPALSVSTILLTTYHTLLVIQFGMIAFINLLIFSWFDSENDRKDRQYSFVTILGKPLTTLCIWILSVTSILMGLFIFRIDNNHEQPVLTLILMNVILLMLFLTHKQVQHNNLYRLLGDAVFLIPGIYLLWNP